METLPKYVQEFDTRWRAVEAGQLEVKQNLVKFNNFVREKQGKVDGGLARVRTEQELQQRRVAELSELRAERETLLQAKLAIAGVVEGRSIYSEFLISVLAIDPTAYTDIRRLMQRCRALVDTRDKLRTRLVECESATEQQQAALEKFKEQKMGQTLDYNVKLADCQQTNARLAARTLERNTFLHNIQEKITEKVSCILLHIFLNI